MPKIWALASAGAFATLVSHCHRARWEVVGVVQKESGVLHVIAEKLVDHSELLGQLVARSRDLH